VLEGGYEGGEDACARGTAGVTVGCQGIVMLPDTAYELDIATTLHAYILEIAGPPVSQCARNEVERGALPMHDLHREYSHPPRPRFTGISLANKEFDEWCEDDIGLRLELGRELLE
jgi:hypothetical protein